MSDKDFTSAPSTPDAGVSNPVDVDKASGSPAASLFQWRTLLIEVGGPVGKTVKYEGVELLSRSNATAKQS